MTYSHSPSLGQAWGVSGISVMTCPANTVCRTFSTTNVRFSGQNRPKAQGLMHMTRPGWRRTGVAHHPNAVQSGYFNIIGHVSHHSIQDYHKCRYKLGEQAQAVFASTNAVQLVFRHDRNYARFIINSPTIENALSAAVGHLMQFPADFMHMVAYARSRFQSNQMDAEFAARIFS